MFLFVGTATSNFDLALMFINVILNEYGKLNSFFYGELGLTLK
jgi:hypothetical protein